MSQTLDETAHVIDEPPYEVVDGVQRELGPMGANRFFWHPASVR